MSVLIKGITRLSELEIDADKDWQSKGITSLKQIAALMSRGDVVLKDTNVLIRLAAGPDGYVLTSAGPGKLPSWQPAGGTLKYYFPAYIGLSHAQAKVAVNQDRALPMPLIADKKHALVDSPSDYIRRLDRQISLSTSTQVAIVNQSKNLSAPIGRELSIQCDAAVAETSGGVQTDETAAARDPTAGDMNLCPMTPAAEDKYYIGFSWSFRRIWLNVGTPGVGNWANQVEYWNGAWVPAANAYDESSDFTISGLKRVDWDMPVDWVKTTVLGMNLYWIRFRTVSLVNQTIAPRGTQCFCCLPI